MTRIAAIDRRRYAQARRRGLRDATRATAVVDARYDADSEAIVLMFRDGRTISIPRELVPELQHVPAPVFASVSVSPAGDAISWRSADIDVAVSELIERVGSRKRDI